ncbi:hypothetical protein [Microbacterium deminutum]|uniref:Uncharacterized protein n=1 Tax=Microbacterium deminutum TaxID=344164 RepID=A0ABN2QKM0_9MICO
MNIGDLVGSAASATLASDAVRRVFEAVRVAVDGKDRHLPARATATAQPRATLAPTTTAAEA